MSPVSATFLAASTSFWVSAFTSGGACLRASSSLELLSLNTFWRSEGFVMLEVAASRSAFVLQNAVLSPLELLEDFELLLQAPTATTATRARRNAARRDRYVCID